MQFNIVKPLKNMLCNSVRFIFISFFVDCVFVQVAIKIILEVSRFP